MRHYGNDTALLDCGSKGHNNGEKVERQHKGSRFFGSNDKPPNEGGGVKKLGMC